MLPMFSIGVSSPRTKDIKKSRKTSRSQYKFDPIKYIPLDIYEGPRWFLPCGIKTTKSIAFKFTEISHLFSYSQMNRAIKEKIWMLKTSVYFKGEQWKPPSCITGAITSFRAKQENEWLKVRLLYLKLLRFRKNMLAFILNWQFKKCLKNMKNTNDPATMDIPKNPVYIIDFKKRHSFIYEASTLKNIIENRLLLSDYMFPEPKPPVNLLTNEPFTYGQLVSIERQCSNYKVHSWILEGLKKYEYDVIMFSLSYKQPLKLEAIKVFFKRPTSIIRETLLDYFQREAELANLPIDKITKFILAYDRTPEHPLFQKWIHVTRDYYIAKELQDPLLLIRNAGNTDALLDSIYYTL